MTVQSPFYVIKRAAAPTKDEALALLEDLATNADSPRKNLQDMIEFCLSAKEERVYLKLGDTVRLKPSKYWQYATPVPGSVCRVAAFTVGEGAEGKIMLRALTDNNIQRINIFEYDVSAYFELV